MTTKYDIDDRVRVRINYENDTRKEVDATICAIEITRDSTRYKIEFEPEKHDKKQGCTRCEGYVKEDCIIEKLN